MNNQLLEWLLSDAGAGWVFGIISVIALIASYIHNRKKSSIIIIKELSKTSFINLSSKIKDRVSITYDNKLVDSIGYVKVEIYNDGFEVIKQPILTFSVPEEATILQIEVDTPVDNFEISSEIAGNKAKVILPYLNPAKDHDHILRMSILMDGPVESLHTMGSGEGWSTRHYKTLEARRLLRRQLNGLTAVFIVSLIAPAYGEYFVHRRLGVDPWGLDFQVILLFFPIYVMMVASAYWMLAPLLSSRPRSRKLFE